MGLAHVRIGDACDLVNGRAFKPSDWTTSGLPIVRIQNLNNENGKFNYFDGEVRERFLIDSGELLFSWSGTPGTSFGAFFWQRGPAVLNQHIFKVVVDESAIHKGYFRYALNSRLQVIMDQAHGGVGLQHITKGKLEGTTVPFPTKPDGTPDIREQRRIAAILDKADAIRRKRQEAIQLTEELLRSTFLEMFGDPVTNPMGWPRKTAKEVLKLKSGRFLPAKNMVSGPFPVFGGNGVNGHHHEFLFAEPTIVVGRVGVYCGVIHRTPPKSWVTDNAMYVAERDNSLSDDYLEWALRLANLNQYASQAAQPLLSGGRIYPVELSIPSQAAQSSFSTVLSHHARVSKQTANATAETDNLFHALVQRAFCGEL